MKNTKESSIPANTDNSVTDNYHKEIEVHNHLATVTANKIGYYDLDQDLRYKPMAYLKHNPQGIGYTFYAFIAVPANCGVHSCHIHQINSTNFVTLIIGEEDSNVESGPEKIFFMEITNMPAPIGFKISSVELIVTTEIPVAGPPTVPQMGKGKVAVDYQDADESM